MGSVIGAGSWDFVEVSFSPSAYLAEVSHTTVLILGQEIVALLVDTECNWIGPWSRHLHPLTIFFMRLASEAVGRFGKSSSNFI